MSGTACRTTVKSSSRRRLRNTSRCRRASRSVEARAHRQVASIRRARRVGDDEEIVGQLPQHVGDALDILRPPTSEGPGPSPMRVLRPPPDPAVDPHARPSARRPMSFSPCIPRSGCARPPRSARIALRYRAPAPGRRERGRRGDYGAVARAVPAWNPLQRQPPAPLVPPTHRGTGRPVSLRSEHDAYGGLGAHPAEAGSPRRAPSSNRAGCRPQARDVAWHYGSPNRQLNRLRAARSRIMSPT